MPPRPSCTVRRPTNSRTPPRGELLRRPRFRPARTAAGPGAVGGATCPCPCRACPGRLPGPCEPCRADCRAGPPTRRAGCLRNRCRRFDSRNQPPGRLGVGCSTGWRPTPPHAHAPTPQQPCCSRRARRSGQGDADHGPKQRPHDDQELAETAKRSVHKRPPRSNPPHTRLPKPHEPKRSTSRSTCDSRSPVLPVAGG
jgi:hypothetical protein